MDRFRVADWIKTHTAAERSFGKALHKYFSEQADRIADAIGENFPGALPSPEQVPLIFDANAEHEKLRPIVDLRSLAMQGVMPSEELSLCGQARALAQWHENARCCGHCGGTTLVKDGEKTPGKVAIFS